MALVNSLSPKALRAVDAEVARLFHHKALIPVTSAADLKVTDYRVREVELADGRTFLLTDSGLEARQRLIDRLQETRLFEGLANSSDFWDAVQQVLKDCLSVGQRPADGAEFVARVTQDLEQQIAIHRFVALLDGVELKDVQHCQLGAYQILLPAGDAIRAFGGEMDRENIGALLDASEHRLWLTGTARGTLKVALARFEAATRLITGWLAVLAALRYRLGAHAFRIGVAMHVQTSPGSPVFLHWTDRDPFPVLHLPSTRAQPFVIDLPMRRELESDWAPVFRLIDSQSSVLEQALVRAAYWFAEAHRERLMEMRLLKYWSCVETFFSRSPENVGPTQAVTVGLAALLCFGPQRFIPEADYGTLKRRLRKLYDKRSKAAHEAQTGHVTGQEAADLSQWIAWMLMNVLSLAAQGFNTPEQVAEWSQDRDGEHDPREPPVASGEAAVSASPPLVSPDLASRAGPSDRSTGWARLGLRWRALWQRFKRK